MQGELEREFVFDHRRTNKALTELVRALSTRDPEEIRAAAEELDRIAGAHIAFEEQLLYPLVAESRGEGLRRQLIAEHDQVRTALAELRSLDTATVPEDKWEEWQERLQHGLQHIETCGTLLSHLSALDATQKDQLLMKLRQLRDEQVLWTARVQ